MALILVVDDEFGVAEVLEFALADAGHEVVTAVNGRQALERLNERLPDLVLLDFMMPIMDGPTMLKAMREEPGYRNIPSGGHEFASEKRRDASCKRPLRGLPAQTIQAQGSHRRCGRPARSPSLAGMAPWPHCKN